MSVLSVKKRLALELHRQIVKEQAVQHPLSQLFWECTLRCNLHCRHCGSDCKVSASHPDMPFEDFSKVLSSIKEHYDSHKIMVMLTGGEPLMRRDIVKCGRAIYDMEFPWGLVSNGMLMTPGKIDELLSAGLHSATISLDGFEAEHDWMRGAEGSFGRAMEAIKILASEPSVKFDVVTCVNGRNFAYLPQLRDYLISAGLKKWRMFTVFPVGRAALDSELQLKPAQFRELMEFIRNTRKEGKISVSYGCEGFLGEYEGEVRDHLFFCAAGVNIASVLVDGSISACASIRSNYHQGNIYNDDFCEVWENRFSVFRDRAWMKAGKCSACKYFRYCQGNGMHLRDSDGNLLLCHLDRIR